MSNVTDFPFLQKNCAVVSKTRYRKESVLIQDTHLIPQFLVSCSTESIADVTDYMFL